MGEVAKALGVGPELTCKGKSYRLSPLTFEMQAQFEVWLEKRAVEAAKRAARYFTPAEAKEMMAQTMRDIAAGVYSFGGKVCADAAGSLHGLKFLVYLSLLPENPDVTEALVDELFEEKMEEAVELFQQANADPNPKAPAAPAPG